MHLTRKEIDEHLRTGMTVTVELNGHVVPLHTVHEAHTSGWVKTVDYPGAYVLVHHGAVRFSFQRVTHGA